MPAPLYCACGYRLPAVQVGKVDRCERCLAKETKPDAPLDPSTDP